MNKLDGLVYYANIQRARESFWDYCNVMASDFYKANRNYLIEIADELEKFLYDNTDLMVINLPPRFGKSRTACKFAEWAYGKNNKLKIMTASYNNILSMTFAESVRNTICEQKADKYKITYSDIFPDTKIKYGDSAKNMWSVEGSDQKNYLSTSPNSTATGFGADIIIIDDLIKDALEANDIVFLNSLWKWFTDTIYSRSEGLRKFLIIMTQWSSNDLAHRLIEHFTRLGLKVKTIIKGAKNKDGTMLDNEILNEKEYNNKKNTTSLEIFEANYNNVLIDTKNIMYQGLKSYKHCDLPQFEYIASYTDTADEGKDYLCKIIYGRYKNLLYVLDVYYTQDKMEITEIECAKRDLNFKVKISRVESNNGGKGFCRNVERITRELGNTTTRYIWIPQTSNKISRIITYETNVVNTILFPEDWENRFRDYATAMKTFKKDAKNEHDDAPDCTTGCFENEFNKNKVTISF